MKRNFILAMACLTGLAFGQNANAWTKEDCIKANYNSPDCAQYKPPAPTPAPQVTIPVTVGVGVSAAANAKGSVVQKPVINQDATIVQKPELTQVGIQQQTQTGTIQQSATTKSGDATTNAGSIYNLAGGAKVNFGNGSLSPTSSSTATVAPGALVANPTATGGTSSATVERGAVSVTIDNSRHDAPQPKAVATTPTPMQVNPVAPTSFYPIGSPNEVGAAGFVGLYEAHCPTQMSGDGNLIRSKTDYVRIIAALDDQAKAGGNSRTPEARIVKGPQQLPQNSGQCICLGTLQVESVITPEEARDNNMQSVHAAAAKWVRENLRGLSLVQLVYSAEQSVSFQKGTAGHASSRGIGGGGSAAFNNGLVAMVTPSWGSTDGYSTDYPIVGITYVLIGSMNGSEAPMGSRTLDVALFMDQLGKMERPLTWGQAPAPSPSQAATVTQQK